MFDADGCICKLNEDTKDTNKFVILSGVEFEDFPATHEGHSWFTKDKKVYIAGGCYKIDS